MGLFKIKTIYKGKSTRNGKTINADGYSSQGEINQASSTSQQGPSVSMSDISDLREEFKEHTHKISDVDDLQETLDGKASTSHTHTSSDITDLPTSIDNKINELDVSDSAVTGKLVASVSETDGKISVTKKGLEFCNEATDNFQDNTQIVSSVAPGYSSSNPNFIRRKASYLWNYIKGKADSVYAAISHTHAISDVTSLQTTLDGKASASHTHTSSDVTDLSTSIDNKINALDVSDSAVTGKLVASVSETDGKISVTKKGLEFCNEATDNFQDNTQIVSSVASGYSSSNPNFIRRKASYLWNYIKSKADSVYAVISHTHTSSDVTDLSSTIDNKINALDVSDTATTGKVVTAVSETNGKITVTRNGYDAFDKATSDFRDETEIITTASTGPSSSSQVLYRRQSTALWNYIKGKSDAIYATQSALAARIPKVTGTDNAVVRFNGTEGMVQNSGVKILDNSILITPNGQRVTENTINGTEGTLGAVNFLKLSTTSTYRNQPIILQYVGRSNAGYIIVNLAGGSTAGNISNATVSTIVLIGTKRIYYKIADNTLYLYYDKMENYDNMSITFLGLGQYQAVGLSLTWVNTIQSSTSGLTAASYTKLRADMYLDEYTKASSASAITTSDTMKSAIGKLEKGLDNVSPNSFGIVRRPFVKYIGDNIASTTYGVVCRFKCLYSDTARSFTLQINARAVVHNVVIYAGRDGLTLYDNSYGINANDSPIYGYVSDISGDSTYKLVTIYMKMVGYRYGASVVRVELPVYYYESAQRIKDVEYPNYEYVTTLPSGYVTATVNATAKYDEDYNVIKSTYKKKVQVYKITNSSTWNTYARVVATVQGSPFNASYYVLTAPNGDEDCMFYIGYTPSGNSYSCVGIESKGSDFSEGAECTIICSANASIQGGNHSASGGPYGNFAAAQYGYAGGVSGRHVKAVYYDSKWWLESY